jgi:acyl-CoA thioesterase FadM
VARPVAYEAAAMRLRFRLFWLLLASLWRKPMSVLGESVRPFRVLPNDVDVRKITNDRFIALMDLGRMDIAFRVGLFRRMLREHWAPLVTFTTIRFRHPLTVFEKYRLHSRIIYWDDETFYFEQRFERKGRTVATGYVCATFLGPDGAVAPATIVAAAGQQVERPAKPWIVSCIEESELEVHHAQELEDAPV